MLIISKDALRQSVEAASGGLCTVIYSRKGQPLFLRAVPKFRVQDLHANLGSGVHPAFIVGNREVSEIWVGMYPGFVSDGEILSVPGRPPSTLSYNAAIEMARATGPGVHHLTAAEWAAVAFYSVHSVGGGVEPVSGPDAYGRDGHRFGRRVDGKAPGDTSSTSFCLGGSGPLNWRHDLSPWGIADLVQGWSAALTLVTGLVLRNGEINIIPKNDAALPSSDLSPSSSAWKAIMPNGTLVNPGTTGTLKFDIPPSATYSNDGSGGARGYSYLRTENRTPPFEPSIDGDYTINEFQNTQRDPSSLAIPSLLYQLMLVSDIPTNNMQINGRLLIRPYGFRIAKRGWRGLGGLDISTNTTSSFVTRVAYVPI